MNIKKNDSTKNTLANKLFLLIKQIEITKNIVENNIPNFLDSVILFSYINYFIHWKTLLWPTDNISINFFLSISFATVEGPGCPGLPNTGGIYDV